MHISEDLKWSTHTTHVVKKAQQRLYCLRRLKSFKVSPRILRAFYSSTIESVLTSGFTAWYGNCTALDRKALQRVVRSAQRTVGGELPSLQELHVRRCTAKADSIIKYRHHPSHRLFDPLPHPCPGKLYRSIMSHTKRLWQSFYPATTRLLNET